MYTWNSDFLRINSTQRKSFFNTEKPALENVEFKISKIVLLIDKTILLIL